jgi:hypothetical protein
MKPRCRFGCRFIQVSDRLWLCPHASWGEASYMLGAVEEARRLLEKVGGYDTVLRRLEDEEKRRHEARKASLKERERKAQADVRYE